MESWANTVSARHVANICGVSHGEFRDVIRFLGIKTLNGAIDRQDARRAVSTLVARHGHDEHVRADLLAALRSLSDPLAA